MTRNVRRAALLAAGALLASASAAAGQDPSNLRGGAGAGSVAGAEPRRALETDDAAEDGQVEKDEWWNTKETEDEPQEEGEWWAVKKKKKKKKAALDPDARRKKNGDFAGAAGPGGRKKAAQTVAGEGAAGGGGGGGGDATAVRTGKDPAAVAARKAAAAAARAEAKKAARLKARQDEDDGDEDGYDEDDEAAAQGGAKPPLLATSGPPGSTGIMGALTKPGSSTYTVQGAATTLTEEEKAQLAANRVNSGDEDDSDTEDATTYGEALAQQAQFGAGPNMVSAGPGTTQAIVPRLCGSLTIMQDINSDFCNGGGRTCVHHGDCMLGDVCDDYPKCRNFPKPNAMLGMGGGPPPDPKTLRCVNPDPGAAKDAARTLCTTAQMCSNELGIGNEQCEDGKVCRSVPECKNFTPKKTAQDIIDEMEAAKAEESGNAWLAGGKKGSDAFQSQSQGGPPPGAGTGAQLNSAYKGGGGPPQAPGNPGPNGPMASGQPAYGTGPRISGGPGGGAMAAQQQQQQMLMMARPTFKCVDLATEEGEDPFDPCGANVTSCAGEDVGGEACRKDVGWEFECKAVTC